MSHFDDQQVTEAIAAAERARTIEARNSVRTARVEHLHATIAAAKRELALLQNEGIKK